MLNALKINKELPTEVEEGNIEYKLKIKCFDQKNDFEKMRMKKLASQMKWRLNEGKQLYSKCIAVYIIGITDEGQIGKQTEEQVDMSIKNLEAIALKCNATLITTTKIRFDGGLNVIDDLDELTAKTTKLYCIAEAIIQKYDDKFIKEMRVCLLGCSNSGKTTLISHLCSNHYDNGNGSGRSTIMKHVHEQVSGTTSSICHELIGYKNNEIINYKTSQFGSWEKIVNSSEFIVSLIDLPGSQKYIKTMLYGLMSRQPHIILFTISLADHYFDCTFTIPQQIIQNFELAYKTTIGTSKKIFIVFTKCDMFSEVFENNLFLDQFITLFTKCFTFPIKLEKYNLNYINMDPECISYTTVSNVTGEGFKSINNLLTTCYNMDLYNISDNNIHFDETNKRAYTRFLLGEIYSYRNEFTSNETINIASGLLLSGTINLNEILKLGPFNGLFINAKIKNIHKKQIDCFTLYANEYGSIELEILEHIEQFEISNHMMLTNGPLELVESCEIKITDGLEYAKIKKSYSLYFDNAIESCFISEINDDVVTVKFNSMVGLKVYIKKASRCILKCETYLHGVIV